MTANLHTHLLRSLFALPLLAVGLIAAMSSEAAPSPVAVVSSPATLAVASSEAVIVLARAEAGGGTKLAFTAPATCASVRAPSGAAALARIPGDLGPIAARIRCASL